jgi:hypothetical protein
VRHLEGPGLLGIERHNQRLVVQRVRHRVWPRSRYLWLAVFKEIEKRELPVKLFQSIPKMLPLTLTALAAIPSTPAFGCAACYGESGSPMARGLTWAIVALGSAVFLVLAGVVGFFVHIGRKPADSHVGSTDGGSSHPNN